MIKTEIHRIEKLYGETKAVFHPSGAKVTHTIAATGTPAEQLDVVSKIIGKAWGHV